VRTESKTDAESSRNTRRVKKTKTNTPISFSFLSLVLRHVR
jgi:hypothetical protein